MAAPLTLCPTSALPSDRCMSSPTVLSNSAAVPSKRPKLSLDTQTCKPKSLGRGTTGLRLDVLSATSPTRCNTFKNSFDAGSAAATPRHSSPLLHNATGRRTPTSKPPTPHPSWADAAGVTSPTNPSLNHSSDESSPSNSPNHRFLQSSSFRAYEVSEQPRSILSNSLFGKRQHQDDPQPSEGMSLAPSISPPSKRLRFKEPLHEEIQNKEYIAKHSDLNSPQAAASRTRDKGPALESLAYNTLIDEEPVPDRLAEQAQDDEELYPKTPVAGRRKRSREWVWTLGPLPGREESSTGEGDRSNVTDIPIATVTTENKRC